jgi:hypothetical protein
MWGWGGQWSTIFVTSIEFCHRERKQNIHRKTLNLGILSSKYIKKENKDKPTRIILLSKY